MNHQKTNLVIFKDEIYFIGFSPNVLATYVAQTCRHILLAATIFR
jgi:hypothetical protein